MGQWGSPIPIPGMVAIHSTLMPNGKVLIFYNNPAFGDEERGRAMVWDPATGTGVRRDAPANIWCAGQTLLADGRVLVVGGNLQYQTAPGQPGGSFKGLNEIWLFDPFTESWARGPEMRHGRWYPTVTRLADGRAVISAGWDETGNGAEANNRDIEVYTPAADGRGPGTVQVVDSRDIDTYPHQFLMPDGRVLFAGPRDADTFLLDPNGWRETDIADLNNSGQFGYGSGVLLPGGADGSTKVMVIGGGAEGDPGNLSTATTELYDTSRPADGWRLKAPLPQSRRNVNTVILPDGTLLSVGGNQTGASDGYRKEAALYEPAADRWTTMAAQSEGRGYHSTALLLPDARVLSAGDDTAAGGGWESDVAEIFSPPYLFHGPRPTIAAAPTAIRWGGVFRIDTPDAISRAVLVAPGATTHANDMNQRHIELTLTPVAGGIQAIAPSTAAVAPPGPYMLFLISPAGVPSVARFVRVGDRVETGSGESAPPSGASQGAVATRPTDLPSQRALGARLSNPRLVRRSGGTTFAVTVTARRPAAARIVLGWPGHANRFVAHSSFRLRAGKPNRRILGLAPLPRGRSVELRLTVTLTHPDGPKVVLKRVVLSSGDQTALRKIGVMPRRR